jgi:hypothetical protein
MILLQFIGLQSMTKVYLLIHGQCDYEAQDTVEGVFSTEEAAQTFQNNQKFTRVTEDKVKWGEYYYRIDMYKVQ